MKWVESESVNKTEWDQLVARFGGTVFSLSGYLDATAENWGILYNSEGTGGIVCAYTQKLGIRILYAPFFHRYSEWIGAGCPEIAVLLKVLSKHFRVADAQIRLSDTADLPTRVHQEIYQTYSPNQQVKRMLKKGAKYSVESGRKDAQLLDLLQDELAPRIATINTDSLKLLASLVSHLDPKMLTQLNLMEGEQWRGALWLMDFNDRIIYLKGTVDAEARQSGGMYVLMQTAINLAISDGKRFDFGGSNAEGVRRFNLHWGAYDVTYAALQWNNAPLWWKWIKKWYQQWNKK